jgi:hypothetical protein
MGFSCCEVSTKPMKKASEYRGHADECRMMGRRAREAEHKVMLAEMAKTWENLASQRQEYVARLQRIAALEAPTSPEAVVVSKRRD